MVVETLKPGIPKEICPRSDQQYGENLFSSWSSDKKSKVSAKEAVDSWYEEVKKYTFDVEPRTSGTGEIVRKKQIIELS